MPLWELVWAHPMAWVLLGACFGGTALLAWCCDRRVRQMELPVCAPRRKPICAAPGSGSNQDGGPGGNHGRPRR